MILTSDDFRASNGTTLFEFSFRSYMSDYVEIVGP